MFGIQDVGIILVFLLCIISGLLCITYGVINWNKGIDIEEEQITEEMQWEKIEHEIKENL